MVKGYIVSDSDRSEARTNTGWRSRRARRNGQRASPDTLKAELKRAGLTYEELALRLKAYGFDESKASSITNKLSPATLGAHFFLASPAALGRNTLRVEDM
jgi:Domain of unknown function (DUF6471)